MAENRNLPAVAGTIRSMQELVLKHKDQFAMVLPKSLGIDRFLRVTHSTITLNPKLCQCNPNTFLRALLTLASLGLEPGGALGLAHLVPFWNSRENRLDCQAIIDYKGYIDLAHKSKEVGRITAHIIYENETWKFSEGDVIVHTPLPPSQRGAKKIMVYAKAFDRQGTLIAQEFLWAEEVEDIKAKSLSNKKNTAANPWNLYEEAMWRKSPVRKMAKWMPMSPEMQKAARIEEAQEEGFDIPMDIDLGETGDKPPASDVEQKTAAKTQALKDKLTQKVGTPAGPKPEPVVEGAEATTEPPPIPEQEERKEGDLAGEPGNSDVSSRSSERGPAESPKPPQGERKTDPPAPPEQTYEDPPPPPTQEPARSRAVVTGKGSKDKDGNLFGPKDGPKIESGKKAEDYWIETNMVKCPPGGTREGLMTNTKGFCQTECKYRRKCFLFKD